MKVRAGRAERLRAKQRKVARTILSSIFHRDDRGRRARTGGNAANLVAASTGHG